MHGCEPDYCNPCGDHRPHSHRSPSRKTHKKRSHSHRRSHSRKVHHAHHRRSPHRKSPHSKSPHRKSPHRKSPHRGHHHEQSHDHHHSSPDRRNLNEEACEHHHSSTDTDSDEEPFELFPKSTDNTPRTEEQKAKYNYHSFKPSNEYKITDCYHSCNESAENDKINHHDKQNHHEKTDHRIVNPCGDSRVYPHTKSEHGCMNWNCYGFHDRGLEEESEKCTMVCYIYVILICVTFIALTLFVYFQFVLHCYDCTGFSDSKCATMSSPLTMDSRTCFGKVCVAMCDKQVNYVTRTCLDYDIFMRNSSLGMFCASNRCNGNVDPCKFKI